MTNAIVKMIRDTIATGDVPLAVRMSMTLLEAETFMNLVQIAKDSKCPDGALRKLISRTTLAA